MSHKSGIGGKRKPDPEKLKNYVPPIDRGKKRPGSKAPGLTDKDYEAARTRKVAKPFKSRPLSPSKSDLLPGMKRF